MFKQSLTNALIFIVLHYLIIHDACFLKNTRYSYILLFIWLDNRIWIHHLLDQVKFMFLDILDSKL